jgi:membrane-associated protein
VAFERHPVQGMLCGLALAVAVTVAAESVRHVRRRRRRRAAALQREPDEGMERAA